MKGIKTKEFPKDHAEQHVQAVEIVKDLIKKVLNRDEKFTLTVRKVAKVRYAKDSALILVPPQEVR